MDVQIVSSRPFLPLSFNGRTADFESANHGSKPCGGAILVADVVHLVVHLPSKQNQAGSIPVIRSILVSSTIGTIVVAIEGVIYPEPMIVQQDRDFYSCEPC